MASDDITIASYARPVVSSRTHYCRSGIGGRASCEGCSAPYIRARRGNGSLTDCGSGLSHTYRGCCRPKCREKGMPGLRKEGCRSDAERTCHQVWGHSPVSMRVRGLGPSPRPSAQRTCIRNLCDSCSLSTASVRPWLPEPRAGIPVSPLLQFFVRPRDPRAATGGHSVSGKARGSWEAGRIPLLNISHEGW